MNPIPLPGGWTLTPPANLGTSGLAIPGLPTIPGLDPSVILNAALPAISGSSPQGALIVAAITALFQIGHAIHQQRQAQQPGTNPSLDQFGDQFWSIVTKLFPHPTQTG